MMNITFYVAKQIFVYVPIAHNLTKTPTFQLDMIIRLQKYLPMKCCVSI